MTRTHRLVAALCTSSLMALTGLATAPAAEAVDFFGTGSASCPGVLATGDDGGLGFVTTLRTTPRYSTQITPGVAAVSSARLRAPKTTIRLSGGSSVTSWAGYLVVDGRRSASFVRQAENGKLVSTTKTRGPWAGLRTVVAAAATGDPDRPTTAARYLYGVTTAGVLVRMPVSWNAAGVPGVGAQQVLGRGFGGYSGLRFASYAYSGAHVPVADHLVGVTSSGRFNRVEITRGSRPKVTVRTLARSGFGNIADFVHDQCWQKGDGEAWVVRYRNGSLAHYLDPNITDSTLTGLKRTTITRRLPADVRML